jgi:membrane-associated phospholipid phosphatase
VRWLYEIDLAGFRAIHVDLHRTWLDPLFWVLSYSGLGQVQAIVLICTLFWKNPRSTNFYLVLAGLALGLASTPIELAGVGGAVRVALWVARGIGMVLMVFGAFRELRDRENPLRYYVLPMLSALVVGGVVMAQTIKQLVPRDRPSNLAFSVPVEDFYARSFPSGHSSTSFSIAFMLWLLTRKTEYAWTGRAALVWALFVGLSRIYRGVHWPTDVLAGAFGGMFASALIYLVLQWLGHITHTPELEIAVEEPEVGQDG